MISESNQLSQEVMKASEPSVSEVSSEEKQQSISEQGDSNDNNREETFSDDDTPTATAALQALQRHRLLHLRHAIKCPYAQNLCPISTHCWRLKQLWKHLLKCKDQYCRIPLCVSSRFILNHYGSCPKDTCDVCRPVRDTYKRTHTEEEEKEILQRIPPKRMRVSRSQSNFNTGNSTKKNSFDEDRDTRTRIVKDGDFDPLLSTISTWSVSASSSSMSIPAISSSSFSSSSFSSSFSSSTSEVKMETSNASLPVEKRKQAAELLAVEEEKDTVVSS